MLEAMVQIHERDGRGWKAEWLAFPELCLLTSTALALALDLVRGLEVDAERMRANVDADEDRCSRNGCSSAYAARVGKHRAQAELQTVLAAARRRRRSLAEAVVGGRDRVDPGRRWPRWRLTPRVPTGRARRRRRHRVGVRRLPRPPRRRSGREPVPRADDAAVRARARAGGGWPTPTRSPRPTCCTRASTWPTWPTCCSSTATGSCRPRDAAALAGVLLDADAVERRTSATTRPSASPTTPASGPSSADSATAPAGSTPGGPGGRRRAWPSASTSGGRCAMLVLAAARLAAALAHRAPRAPGHAVRRPHLPPAGPALDRRPLPDLLRLPRCCATPSACSRSWPGSTAARAGPAA